MRRLFGSSPDGKLGTFAGVFTPSALTILGVIMYLRLGWVVGHAGLLGAVVIVLIAHAITVVTGLSISAIATNRTVGTGGAYFMLSRSLGAQVGGAIGVPLFIAQALSFTLYVMGFTEAFLSVVPSAPPRIVGSVVCVGLTLLSLWSADIALKSQYLVMGVIALSLVSFALGGVGADHGLALWPADTPAQGRVSFAVVFAVFFPAVTGITAGVSMSGDLRAPKRAIPRGTMAAIGVGLIVYLGLPVLLAFKAPTATLRGDLQVMQHLAWVPVLVLLGIWGATLSSAVGTVLGAPRTLQALARDGVVPKIFGRGHGPTDVPRVGTVLTFAIAEAGILLGDLNLIAPILTMFFLVTYGMLNLACGLEHWAASPSYSPEIRVPAWLSFLGAGACFYMMLFIHLPAAVVAILAVGGLYALLQRRAMRHSWGDARHGLWAALVRRGLLGLRKARWHPRNWRPNIVVLGGEPRARPHLVDISLWIGGQQGIVTFFQLVEGRLAELTERRSDLEKRLEAQLHQRHPRLLCRVDICRDLYEGMRNVAQSYGLAGIQANTVVLGWSRKLDRAERYMELLRDLRLLDKSLLLVDHKDGRPFGHRRRIDLWWGGLDKNGGLMLLVARLMLAHPDWNDTQLRLCMIIRNEHRREATLKRLRLILREARVQAEPRIHAYPHDERPVSDIIAARSTQADLVILGMQAPEPQTAEADVTRINKLVERLPTVLLVRAADAFEGAEMVLDAEANGH